MKDFADDLLKALKYSTTNWEAFQKLLADQPHHRWGGPDADVTLRGAAADAYTEDTGDEEGAAHLRNPTQHVVIDGCKVKKGRFNTAELRDWLEGLQQNLEDWANADGPHGLMHIVHSIPDDGPLTVETRYNRPMRRREGGGGHLVAGVPPESTMETYHPTEAGKKLADIHQQALNQPLGWNEHWNHTDWDEGQWNDLKGSVEHAIEGLRNVSVEEVVPEENK